MFGERVRDLRKAQGISQEKLAELAELHRTYIAGVERGGRNVSLINILKLSRAIRTSPSELMKGLDLNSSPPSVWEVLRIVFKIVWAVNKGFERWLVGATSGGLGTGVHIGHTSFQTS